MPGAARLETVETNWAAHQNDASRALEAGKSGLTYWTGDDEIIHHAQHDLSFTLERGTSPRAGRLSTFHGQSGGSIHSTVSRVA